MHQMTAQRLAPHRSDDLALAIAAATRAGCGGITCFARSWSAVDEARERIEALGLAHRISVHHRLAAAIAGGPALRRSA